jgi:peptide/nickel transport system substrate-binding protein
VRARLLLLFAPGVAVLSACGGGARTLAPDATLSVAIPADVTGIYPEMNDESLSYVVSSYVFEGLTRVGSDLRPQPAVADRWTSVDEHTWLFHLRQGLRFSDGSAVRVADVVASLRYAIRPGAVTRDTLAALASVEAASDSEVRLKTRFPYPVLPSHLPDGFVLPETALAQTPVPPIGTGRYCVERRVRGKEIDLAENRLHWGGRPGFAKLRLRVIPDGAERARALRSGEVQVADSVPANEIEELTGRADLSVVRRPGLRVLFLAMRMSEPPFSDARVREALDLALDRPELIRRALDGHGTQATQLVPPAVLGFDPDIRPLEHDRARARRLLEAAGYRDGFSVRLDGPNNRYFKDREILAEVARQLGEVGVRVEVNARPKEEFFALLAGTPSFYLLGWACDTLHAGDALDALVHTPGPGGLGFNNAQALSDPQLDRMIDAADATPTLRERSQLLSEALARVAQLRPILPLVIQTETLAWSRKVAWEPPIDMSLRLWDAQPAPDQMNH